MKLGAKQRYLRGDQMQRDETPIEWERDSMGRKFRRIGKGCIEYAPTISLAGGGEIYEDELEDGARLLQLKNGETVHRLDPAPLRTDVTQAASVSNAKFSMMGNAVLPP